MTSCVGCSNLGYYAQSIHGHMSLMNQRQPINDLLVADQLTETTRKRLEIAVQVRDFATLQLGLPDNGSYRSYVDLDREYVVWNVVAAAEFSMQPKEWCFPIAGCVSYRGYYAKSAAEDFAAGLKAEGYDVAITPSPAYSTLGWFDDPVLNTMFKRGELILAETIFHELAHQQLYIKDDSVFNEAFASSVGETGVHRWLLDSNRQNDQEIYRKHLLRKTEFIALLRQTADRLKALYQESITDDQMRQRKAAEFTRLKEDYAVIKQSWDGYQGYDRWFSRELNNARLASVAVYRDRVPDFMRWLDSCDDDLERFYEAVARLGELEKSLRHERLMGVADCGVEDT